MIDGGVVTYLNVGREGHTRIDQASMDPGQRIHSSSTIHTSSKISINFILCQFIHKHASTVIVQCPNQKTGSC